MRGNGGWINEQMEGGEQVKREEEEVNNAGGVELVG